MIENSPCSPTDAPFYNMLMKGFDFGKWRKHLDELSLQYMMKLYCRHHHGDPSICSDCLELLNYAICRQDRCRFGPLKPVCSKCMVHCYKRDKAEAIQKIMAYSGPRMSWRHPFLAAFHFYERWAFQAIDPRKH